MDSVEEFGHGPILASGDIREHKSFAKIGPGRRLWGNRHSGVEKHTPLLYKNYFKDTNWVKWLDLIEIVFFLSNYYVLFTCVLFYYLPDFIFDFFRYARAYVRTGSYAPGKEYRIRRG